MDSFVSGQAGGRTKAAKSRYSLQLIADDFQ
jgi:hypothetical protein